MCCLNGERESEREGEGERESERGNTFFKIPEFT